MLPSLNFQQRNSNAECGIVPLETIIKEKIILRNKSVELHYSYSLWEVSENGTTGCANLHCVRLGLHSHRETININVVGMHKQFGTGGLFGE